MCTVTYLPLGNNNFILTSNRDETPLRKTIFPQKYIENNVAMIYPKDEKAGGTWIGLSEKNRLVCLLNGGFKNHTKKEVYKMSRGVIVKKILSVDNLVDFIKEFDFENIEPFTIVLVDWSTTLKVYELVWDGCTKHFRQLDNQPKIWSSSTLYTQEMKAIRTQWFVDWIAKNTDFNQQEIIKFHSDDSKGTSDISLKMKRPNVETVSITSLIKKNDEMQLSYIDLVDNQERKSSIFF